MPPRPSCCQAQGPKPAAQQARRGEVAPSPTLRTHDAACTAAQGPAVSATWPGSRAHGQRPRRPTQVRCPVQDRPHPVTPGPAFTRQCWCKCTVTGRKLTGAGRPGALGPGGRPAEQPRALLASGHRAPGRPRGRQLDSLLQGAGRGDPGQAAWREALLPTPCEHSERERGHGKRRRPVHSG